MKPAAAWARPFDDAILLPGGRELLTLRDAADYIMKLPKADQDLEEWQTAIGCLIGAAEGRDSSGTNDCPAGMADAPQLHALTEPMSYISPHHDRAP